MNTHVDDYWTSHYQDDKDFRSIATQAITKFLSYTNKSLEKTCLDIGCGTGQLTRELYHRGYACTGIDISSEAIAIASPATNVTELSYLHFDIEEDDTRKLPRSSYSLITCKLVYAFIQNRDAFLDRVKSLLAINATFVIITPTYNDATEATPISVDFNETRALLESKFADVKILEIDGFTYYICS